MGKKENKAPDVVFIGRPKHRVKHVITVFQILDKHEDGTPKTCVRIRDDEKIDVEEGMEFMTAYVQAQMITEKDNG